MNATPVVIAYGSNLGDSLARIHQAASFLSNVVQIQEDSGLFVSAPMYVTDQDDFLNGAWVGSTTLGPLALVAALKEIEVKLGRTPGLRNGPRLIDLDLIQYGSLILSSHSTRIIQVPHPRVHERRFVLEPWLTADPSARLTGAGSVSALVQNVQDQRLERYVQTSSAR